MSNQQSPITTMSDFSTELEHYLHRLVVDRPAAVAETSHYGSLQRLLNAAGQQLAAPVHALIHPADSGAGLPDLGLFAADDADGGKPRHGVVEVKAPGADLVALARGEQVKKYLLHYGQVLVTNYHGFLLVTLADDGSPRLEETYHLAEDAAAFWRSAAEPRTLARAHSATLCEYLIRVLRRSVPLRTPQEVAQTLASYARAARARLEQPDIDFSALTRIRTQLEEGLGLHFQAERGEAFFRSSLVQTLFYGIFSAWVLWHEHRPTRTDRFDLWRHTRHLPIPAVRLLFEQIVIPSALDPLGVEEIMNWTVETLNRVERGAFFAVFGQGEAVQYFYEPFLEAFDPDLRRQLGVWYTPPEVVDYMVARVDDALRQELGIADGLADERVTVLDPCCGTGAYLVGVMRLLYRRYGDTVGRALAGRKVADAVQSRLFGFEILPAPFVVAHLQIGLLLAGEMRAGLRADQRAAVYLTNALTGWDQDQQPTLANNILAREYEAAAAVKQEREILVILGNPPYSGFAGIAMDEERGLVEAYRRAERAPQPQGQGLNDLYVRFFRMAERRIVEMTGRGIVCFISNYSWLDGLSHTGMRERYLDCFDAITIDSLNGDKYRTGKTTPDGAPDPSIFSTPFNREGIQVGTAIATLVRRSERTGDLREISYRDLWGTGKLAQLRHEVENGLASADAYTVIAPSLELGYPLMPRTVGADYLNWPKLPELFPENFPGVQSKRDEVVVDIDRSLLVERMKKYFDPTVSHAEMQRICERAIVSTNRDFDPITTREYLQRRGFLEENVIRYCYRPFDMRWIYYEQETYLLQRRSPDYYPHVRSGNVWIEGRRRHPHDFFDRGYVVSVLADNFGNGFSNFFPLYLYDEDPTQLFQTGQRENLSLAALRYLSGVGADAETLFYHALAVLHAPAYRLENAGALRQDWPRLPLPADGDALRASAALGRRVAALLDAERPVTGVTVGPIRAELRPIARFEVVDDGAPDLAVTAGWGYSGNGGVTMPGRGQIREESDENGEPRLDIFLNGRCLWRGVPAPVWAYTLGGYQVLKKWLSYREASVLGRPLHTGEVEEFTAIARRIAALLALAPDLDVNYRRVGRV